MSKLIDLAIHNARLTLSVLMFFLVAGALAYQSIPKEAEPDIQIPIIYVSLGFSGISPEDSERLLLRPMEAALKNIKDIKEMRSSAFQGGGFVLVEFQAGANLSDSLEDVRSKVSDASATCRRARTNRRSTRSIFPNSRCLSSRCPATCRSGFWSRRGANCAIF
jgi:multidrug efflux pump subunit AcrB